MFNHGLWTKLFCFWMLFALPSTMMGADKAAMLYGTGQVTINTNPVKHPSAVFAGDRIQTGSDSAVTLTFPGTRVSLAANSSISYQPNKVLMDYGRALLEAKKGTVAQMAGLTIAPAAAGAKFQLTETRGTVQVAALDGALAVSDGLHTVKLPAGQEMSQDSAQGSASAAAGTTASAPTATVGGGMPGWAIGAIVAGVAGGTTGGLAAAGTFSSGNNPSPSQP
jgi:FecR protein